MIHPFEAAGLGVAPFRVVGYEKAVYQACPEAPIQAGSSCDFCGTGIMHVFHILSADEKRFHVGCDCVARTKDGALISGTRRARWDIPRQARQDAEDARRQASADRNATALAMVLEGALVVQESPNASTYDRGIATRVLDALTSGAREGVTEWEWQTLSLGYAAALLPASTYAGTVGARLRGLPARYEGGPPVGVDGPYPSVLGRFRLMTGEVLIWKTAFHPCKRGAIVNLTGTVKSHKEYDGQRQTWVSRCKVEIVDESESFEWEIKR